MFALSILVMCGTEVMATVLSLISPLVPNSVIGIFAIIAFIKIVVMMRYDFDKDLKALLLITAVSLFYDVGILIRFLSGHIYEISELKDTTYISLLGIIIGLVLCKSIYNKTVQEMKPVRLAILGGILFIVANAFLIILYGTLKTSNGDGSIALDNYSFQLPELIKLELVISVYVTSKLMKTAKEYILFFYTTVLVSLVMLAGVFREWGTTLLIVYFTFVVAFFLSSSQHTHLKSHRTISKIICSNTFPITVGSIFFMICGITKRVLYNKFPYRGAKGESLYGFDNTLYNLSSRLSGDSAQVQAAHQSIKIAWPIQLNLNSELSIPNALPKTAIADYAYVMVVQAFGKLIAPLLFFSFAIALLFSIRNRGDALAKASVAMILLQIFVQISGIIFQFCFTGVNIPFLSAGGSSALSSFVLFTFILYSIRRNYK